jgi:hypothetical protein
MAHRGFTLGELGLVCFGGTAVFMEFLNITMARVRLSLLLFHHQHKRPPRCGQ